jgi:ADP-ribose pyrophosphatase YjhB (NUDIX family)
LSTGEWRTGSAPGWGSGRPGPIPGSPTLSMTKPKRLSSEEFKDIYGKVPRLCVDVVIQSKDGVVLSKRDIPPAKGMWHIPGGTVFFGESLEKAAHRIAKEETGLTIKVVKMLSYLEYSPVYAFNHSVSLEFLCSVVSGKLRGCFQAKELKFFKVIPENTIPEQEKFLKDYLKMR